MKKAVDHSLKLILILALVFSLLFIQSCETSDSDEIELVESEVHSKVSESIQLCHYAKSDNIWELISVNENALSNHLKHGDIRLDDEDGDGFVPFNNCGYGVMGDCNDNNENIYPGVVEICGNNIDDNCDGEVDEDCNYITDIEGNVYETITIGTQTWMAENLRTTKFNDGVDILNAQENVEWYSSNLPAYCWYENDKNVYSITYGALYNWYAVETGKLSPEGWHVPTYDDWIILQNYLIANGFNYDSTNTGNKIALSLSSENNWSIWSGISGTPGSTDFPEYRNKSGFNGQPSGFRDSTGAFGYLGDVTYWWSSSIGVSSQYQAISTAVLSWMYDLNIGSDPQTMGFSIRCVKD